MNASSVNANIMRHYQGNPKLKDTNVPMQYTQHQIQEIIRCKNDPIYLLENYVKIVNIDKGIVPFSPYDYQKDLVTKFTDNRFVICKMPRQSGKSTIVIGYFIWYLLFHPYVSVAILANKGKTAQELLGRFQFAYEKLPFWLQQGVVTWNKQGLELENGASIISGSTSSSAIRGGSFNVIFLDEFAHIENHVADQFFQSVYPTISSGQTSKIFMVSTPKGMNLFYKIWKKAVEGKNEYVPVDIHWSQVPGRDEAWKKQTIDNTSESQFQQEFECEFLGSTDTLISGAKLKNLVFTDPISPDEDDLDVHEYPKKDHKYIITVDASEGKHLDYTTFIVVDVTELPYKIVAKYRSNDISVYEFPYALETVARQYNEAQILFETNSVGGEIASAMYREVEYENIIRVDMQKGLKGKGQIAVSEMSHASQLGVLQSSKTKRIGCTRLKTLIERDKLTFSDFDILSELSTFVKIRNSYQAEEGHNDDLAMCMVTFAWLTDQPFFKDYTSSTDSVKKGLTQALLGEQDNELVPMIVDDGITDPENEMIDENGDIWVKVEEDDPNWMDSDVTYHSLFENDRREW